MARGVPEYEHDRTFGADGATKQGVGGVRVRLLVPSVVERVERLELPFGEFGYDEYGVSKQALSIGFSALYPFYRHYFRVECRHIDRVPSETRAMLVANHSGGFATDAMMLIAACFFEMEPPRLAQGMADKYLGRLPFASRITGRVGQLTGLPSHAERLLESDRLLLVFPEGIHGTRKLYRERRQLIDFGSGFLRLAMKTDTPIIPVAVLGGGEALPTIANLDRLGRAFGLPYVPLTPYLLPVPLPAKMTLHFGRPMTFDGTGDEDDETIFANVESVRAAIAELVRAGGTSYRALS